MVQRHVFDPLDDPRLHAFVVWGPMLGEEVRSDAVEATRFLDDERTTHFWTTGNAVAARFSGPLGLPEDELAWDTFLLFSPGQLWSEDESPQPAFFMHVGRSLPDALRLHAPTIRRRAEEMLDGDGDGGDGDGGDGEASGRLPADG